MPRRSFRDLAGGLILAAIALLFLVGAFDYRIGTATQMGPGFFPMGLSIVALGVAIAIIAMAFRQESPPVEVSWRPLLAILAAIGVCALSIRSLGLVPSLALTVFVSAIGDSNWKPISTLLLAIVIPLALWAIFAFALGLPIRAFRVPF